MQISTAQRAKNLSARGSFGGSRNPMVRRFADAPWLAPAVGFATLFYIVPVVLNFVYAFTNWNTYTDKVRFIGLSNFTEMFREGSLGNSLRITIVYAVVVVIAQNGAGLLLAIALEKTTRTNGLFRALFFIPVLISPLAAGYLFRAILQPDGPLNQALSAMTGHTFAVAWLGNARWTIVILALVNAWKFMGINMLVYIAGLSTIPGEVIGAARVDGASWWQTLVRIKLPFLGPAVTFGVVTTLIGSFNTFDIVYSMTGGGPGIATQVLNAFVQQQYAQGYYGYAISMSLVLLMLVLIFAIPTLIVLRRREVEL